MMESTLVYQANRPRLPACLLRCIPMLGLILLAGCASDVVGPDASVQPSMTVAEILVEVDLKTGTAKAVSPSQFAGSRTIMTLTRDYHVAQDSVKCVATCYSSTRQYRVYLRHILLFKKFDQMTLIEPYCYNCTWGGYTFNQNPLPTLYYDDLFHVDVTVSIHDIPATEVFKFRFFLEADVTDTDNNVRRESRRKHPRQFPRPTRSL